MEACPPTELDPDTFATLGECNLDGVVVQAFSAHPHRIVRRRASDNFGMCYRGPSRLDIYELSDTLPVRRLTTVLVAPGLLHDFIATERYLMFFVPPLRLHGTRGLGSFSDNLTWRPSEGTEVIVLPIDESEKVTRLQSSRLSMALRQ
jgi:all-trans-8'-apo-beta-carotenal 15,15'-oxygenase